METNQYVIQFAGEVPLKVILSICCFDDGSGQHMQHFNLIFIPSVQ